MPTPDTGTQTRSLSAFLTELSESRLRPGLFWPVGTACGRVELGGGVNTERPEPRRGEERTVLTLSLLGADSGEPAPVDVGGVVSLQ